MNLPLVSSSSLEGALEKSATNNTPELFILDAICHTSIDLIHWRSKNLDKSTMRRVYEPF